MCVIVRYTHKNQTFMYLLIHLCLHDVTVAVVFLTTPVTYPVTLCPNDPCTTPAEGISTAGGGCTH